MSGYKKNAASNRDALFGGIAESSSGGNKKGSKKRAPAAAAAAAPSTTSAATTGTSKGYQSKAATSKGSSNNNGIPSLSGAARDAKIAEAENYREKANKCMSTGLFKKADPLAASTYFKRAADCYKQAGGEVTLERLYRIESGKCNQQIGVWASVASDLTRAAELTLLDETAIPDETQRRRDASNWHKQAAQAWLELDEKAKAAHSQVAASLALLQGTDASSSSKLSSEALRGMEEAVEAHVPDPLNPYARYRQTGASAFLEEGADEFSADAVALAQQHVVSRSYAHEPVQQLVHLLTGYREYASALYAAGAATALLQRDGLSTLSLSRAYLVETILTLALGDPVAAEQAFLNVHVQKDFYLKSRECQCAEELFRAIKARDADALEEARSPGGPNRAALANLPHDSLRRTVQELRVAGVARAVVATTAAADGSADKKGKPTKEEKPLQEVLSQKTGYEQDVAAGAALDGDALSNELDNLDFGGLGSDDDDSANAVGDPNDELDGLEDDDIDLR